mgnify:CR=1 FL=1
MPQELRLAGSTANQERPHLGRSYFLPKPRTRRNVQRAHAHAPGHEQVEPLTAVSRGAPIETYKDSYRPHAQTRAILRWTAHTTRNRGYARPATSDRLRTSEPEEP